jgi:hypothetical protein
LSPDVIELIEIRFCWYALIIVSPNRLPLVTQWITMSVTIRVTIRVTSLLTHF